jgi:hypothetical protein
MTIRTKLRKDAMKMAVSILQSAKDPNNLHKTHGKYLVVPDHYDLKRQADKRLLAHPLLQPLIAERFADPWPSLDAMSDMPSGSLGFCVYARVKGLGIKELEFPPPSSDSAEDYLNNRVLVVEVKARRYAGIDGWGAAAFHHTKRRCLARTVACWQADS